MVDSIDSISWSDENYFSLGGGINTYNAIIWVDEKPSHIISKPLDPKKVFVWVGFTSKFMFDPIIFEEGTINGKGYFEMIRDNVIPQLKMLINHIYAGWCTSSYLHASEGFAAKNIH